MTTSLHEIVSASAIPVGKIILLISFIPILFLQGTPIFQAPHPLKEQWKSARTVDLQQQNGGK